MQPLFFYQSHRFPSAGKALRRKCALFLALFFLVFLGMAFQPLSAPKLKLVVFEGSDWCANCQRLEKNLLSDSFFVQRLSNLGVEVERVDFPQRKKLTEDKQLQNETLAEQYAFDGNFPTLFLSRADTLRYLKIGYANQSSEEFLNMLQSKLPQLE